MSSDAASGRTGETGRRPDDPRHRTRTLDRPARPLPRRPDDRRSTSTIVNVALPSIADDLGFSETSLAWVVNAYLLTFGGFLLLGGRLGDLFGQRRLFLAGITLFTGASIVCGLSTTPGDAGRRAGGAGARRRRRLGGRALADHGPLHRPGRAGEGAGRFRVLHGRRRQHRRAAWRRPHRPPELALDLPRQRPDRDRGRHPDAAADPGTPGQGSRPHRHRRRGHGHGRADARGVRDRERERERLALGARRSACSAPRRRCSPPSS